MLIKFFGLDGIVLKYFKFIFYFICKLFVKFFNRLFKLKCFLNLWKYVNVILVLKYRLFRFS